MEKLKPCPFCGGEACLRETLFTGYGSTYDVVCLDCNSQIKPYCITKEEAIAAWNRRAERSEDQFHPFADSVKMGERSESADKCTKCKYYDSETYSCNDAWLPEGVCPFVERSKE